MDSKGNLYLPEEKHPGDAIEVPTESIKTLSDLNRRCRMIYYSERRHGATEEEALQTAIRSLPR